MHSTQVAPVGNGSDTERHSKQANHEPYTGKTIWIIDTERGKTKITNIKTAIGGNNAEVGVT